MDLRTQEVHIWHADLRAPELETGVLDADERARAARFRTSALRERYRRCRCALRSLLGGQLMRAGRAAGHPHAFIGPVGLCT